MWETGKQLKSLIISDDKARKCDYQFGDEPEDEPYKNPVKCFIHGGIATEARIGNEIRIGVSH